jgi:S1-C subfamily serine protease
MIMEEEKKSREDTPSFIKEQIVPNKKNKRKKLFHSLETAVLCAIVFGILSSFTFTLSTPYFEKIFGKPEDDSVSFTKETPLPTATPSVTPTPSPTTTPAESLVPKIDTDYIQDFFDVISETANSFHSSVVTVSGVVTGVDWFDNPSELSAATCGIILAKTEKTLYILSAYDRISDATAIRITFSGGTTVEAQVNGYDKETNLMVLSVSLSELSDSLIDTLTPVELGDTFYAQPGTPILALGSPNGSIYSMDFGIVSSNGIDRYITDNKLELFSTSMQYCETGEGVIVGLDGRVLGIITHTQDSSANYLTAIGISRLKSLIEKLVNKEASASLGIVAHDIPSEYKDTISIENGIYVFSVNNNSPALTAGLQSGDIILALGDREITGVAMLNSLLSGYQPKDTVTLTILRTTKAEDNEMSITVTLGKK